MTHYFLIDVRELELLHDDFAAGRTSDESFVETVRQMIEEHELHVGDRVVLDRRTDPHGCWWTIDGINDYAVWCSSGTAAPNQEFPISAIVAKAGKVPS